MLAMGEAARDLLACDAVDRERRQFAEREEACGGRLGAERAGFAPHELAAEEDLPGVPDVRWVMPRAVEQRDHLDGARLEARLLAHFAHDRLGRRLAHLGPA